MSDPKKKSDGGFLQAEPSELVCRPGDPDPAVMVNSATERPSVDTPGSHTPSAQASDRPTWGQVVNEASSRVDSVMQAHSAETNAAVCNLYAPYADKGSCDVDRGVEYGSFEGEYQRRLEGREEREQRSLDPHEQTRMKIQLTRNRNERTQAQLEILYRQRAEQEARIHALQQRAYIEQRQREGWEFEPFKNGKPAPPPTLLQSVGDEAEDTFIETPKRMVAGAWNKFKQITVRGAELREQAYERGDYLGGTFGSTPYAIGEAVVDDIETGLDNASDALARALDAKSATDAAIATMESVADLGQAALSAYAMADPLAAITDLPAAGGSGGAFAMAGADGRTLAGVGEGGPLAEPGSMGPAAAGAQGARYEQDEIEAEYKDVTEQGRGPDKAGHVTADEIPDAEHLHDASAREAGAQSGNQHHVLPQEHRKWFEERGVDIDDFTVNLPEADHQAIHGGADFRLGRKEWSGEWNHRIMAELKRADAEAMRRTGKPLSPDRIVAIAKDLMEQYKIPATFERYAKAPKKRSAGRGATSP